MNLTRSQQDAIAYDGGHLQLLACAGSGKTEVVARRIARLLGPSDGAAPRLAPRSIVAFTFTERAASELKDRIIARVQSLHGEVTGLAEMYVGTIHGFCLELLRTEVPSFAGRVVLNEITQRMLVERHPERSGRARTRTLLGLELAPWKDTGVYLGALDVLRQAELLPHRLTGVSVAEGLVAWRELLEARGFLDYTSIMEHAVRVLQEDEAARARLRARLQHVVVDEYQDVNPIQERVITALAELGARLCVVGDDDQSIYQWNGASVENILGFAQRYPDVHTVPLQENFRSSDAVVGLARAFIAQNRARLPKEMVATGAQPTAPGDILARTFAHPDEEAAWIAGRFLALRGAPFRDGTAQRGLAWSDMCVLIRSDPKRNAAPLVEAFRQHEIPYLVTGLNNLFTTREAQAAACLFQYLSPGSEPGQELLFESWKAALPGCPGEALEEALRYAAAVREEIEFEGEELAWALVPQRVFFEFLSRLPVGEASPTQDPGHAETLLANLGVFSRLLDDFEGMYHRTSLQNRYVELVEFLENTARDQYPDALGDTSLASPDAVRIMTIHKAKGLEWPVVALPGLVESRFPMRFFQQDARKKKRKDWWDLVPLDAVVGGTRYQGTLEDERRLFYVALTRAQKHLLLSFAPSPEFSFWRSPSQFFQYVARRPEVSQANPDAPAPLPSTPRRGVSNVRLDFTTLKNLFECPKRFQLQTVYGFSPPHDAAEGFGASLHDALAEIHHRGRTGRPVGVEEVPALVATHLRLPFATPELFERRRVAAVALLTRYLERHGDALEAVEFVEQTIELPMGDGVTVVGRIDLVLRRDGRASIVDFKSSAHAQSELQSEAQLHLYALGYRALTGRDAESVEVWELDEDARSVHPVDESMLAQVRASTRAAAGMLREGRFPVAVAPERCGPCAMRGLCPAGQAELARDDQQTLPLDAPA